MCKHSTKIAKRLR